MRYLLIIIAVMFATICLISCEKGIDPNSVVTPDWNYGSDCHAGYTNHCGSCHPRYR